MARRQLEFVIPRLSALLIAAGPASLTGCGCPTTDYRYDRTARLDPNNTHVAVQEAIAASIGEELSMARVCLPLCGASNTGTETLNVIACERGELEGDPAVICHMSGHDDCGGVGRRPPGLCDDTMIASDPCAAYLARATALEGASVHAFLLLAEELAVHGAPVELVDWARRAAIDELEHTRVMAALTRRYGGQPVAPRVRADALVPRAALEMALDNAVEGCVHETLGALVAAHQACHAADSQVRHALAHIARDEANHALLSWRISEWFEGRASVAERRKVSAARRSALRAAAKRPQPTSLRLRRELGLPGVAERRALAMRLRDSVDA
ncbi:MAG: ferritin-like domain-containing protein [Polyangiaceae bacterium]